MQFDLPVQTNGRLRQLAECAPFYNVSFIYNSWDHAMTMPKNGVSMGVSIRFEWWNNGAVVIPQYVCEPMKSASKQPTNYRLLMIFAQKTKKYPAEWQLKLDGVIPMDDQGMLFLALGTKLLNGLHHHLTTVGGGYDNKLLETLGLLPHVSNLRSTNNWKAGHNND